MPIHPTAIVDPSAQIDETAVIGPFCVVGAEVTIGAHTGLKAHVFVDGPTTIGEENIFYPYSTVGVAPQDLKYHGERAETRIGNRNKIREFVTIHRGTAGGGLLTSIGNENLLMAYSHIAHDVHLGSHCVLANGVTLAGHVLIGDWAVIGAFTGVHQFCRIGKHAMVGGSSVITQDVMPFATNVSKRDNAVVVANATGLERRGFDPAAVEHLQNALRILTRANLNTTQALARIEAELPATPEIADLVEFIRSSERGVIK
ncbi:MAG: acyl-ACP--UDP-N-acetylglucosamine O-acyltransferase [Acidobacteriota bacterium]